MLTGPPFKFTGPISTLPPPKIKNYFKISVRTILTYFTTFIFSMPLKVTSKIYTKFFLNFFQRKIVVQTILA
jgi:hypothetical protein